jgi:hypothetical protein
VTTLRQELARHRSWLVTARTERTTITAIVAAAGGPGRGGGTTRVAEAAGVSMREVQRWLKYERGEGGQVRSPEASPLFRALREREIASPLDRMASKGAQVAAIGDTAEDRIRQMPAMGTQHLPPEQLAAFVAAMRADRIDDAAEAFADAFFAAYGFDAFGDAYGFVDLDFFALEPAA